MNLFLQWSRVEPSQAANTVRPSELAAGKGGIYIEMYASGLTHAFRVPKGMAGQARRGSKPGLAIC